MSTSGVTLDREGIQFAAKDAGLRRDVHLLGEQLGELLREQGGDALYENVESARRAAIRRRQSPEHDDSELTRLFDELPAELTRDFIRAFSSWFQVVNMAEQVHRIRRRRAYQRDKAHSQPGGLDTTFLQLRKNGCSLEQLRHLLASTRFQPVFTAHPTEPTRRTLLQKQQRIAGHLLARLDPSMTPAEESEGLDAVRMEMTTAWQTEEHPSSRMAIADELEHILFFLTDVIYPTIPDFYTNLENAVHLAFPEAESGIVPPGVLRFGSWVGADLKGNPDISARTIKETLNRQRTLILDRYRRDCLKIASQLTQSRQLVDVDEAVEHMIESYTTSFPRAMHGVHRRHREMPYRVALQLIAARIYATFEDADRRYRRVDQFVADLETIATSLETHNGMHAGAAPIRKLIWKAETFGFHMVTVDVRLDAAGLREAVSDGLGEQNWEERLPAERAAILSNALESEVPATAELGTATRRTLGILETLALCRRRYGKQAIGSLLIGDASGPDDLLSILLLAQWAALTDRSNSVPLDICPQVERSSDLDNTAEMMRVALEQPAYRKHLHSRGDRQLVMISYADSTREGGLADARWRLYRLQTQLQQAISNASADLTICHERGGTISRGGAKTHNVVLGSPPGTVNGLLVVTEPGEMMSVKYGLQGVALRNFERAVSSIASATNTVSASMAEQQTWNDIMKVIARNSRQKYRGMIFDDPAFADYFRQATPIDVIERMQIGSRPMAAAQNVSIESMRSIPWVFAWTQNRCFLPGWFGVGSGIDAAITRFGLETMTETVAQWPFLDSLLEDLELVLAKCDMDIVSHYNDLVEPSLRHFFDPIFEEYELTVRRLLQLRGTDVLLQRQRSMQRAIRLRNPYVDPISLLQTDLLKRWRSAERPDDATLAALFASINGIAHALQNTG
jgi:phosphoenolpyruvate carboxylase